MVDFVISGDAAGLDPTPYFSTTWYKRRYPNWGSHSVGTAFQDFLLRVINGEKRQPHPLIDPDYYQTSYPDLTDLGTGAVLHFFRHGDSEGRNPSAGFDADFYRLCYLPLGTSSPFHHYITNGHGIGFLPQPLLRDATASESAMRQEVTRLRNAILLVSHDAQAAGRRRSISNIGSWSRIATSGL